MKSIFLISETQYGQAGWSFKKAFEKLGYKVMTYESFIYPFPQTKRTGIWSKLAGGMNLIRNIIRANILFPRKELRACQPDMVLVFKGTTFAPRTIKKMKSIVGKDTLLVNRNADNPFADYNTSMWYLQSIKYYDEHITFAQHLKTTLETVGAKKVLRIPFRYDPLLMPIEDVSVSQEDEEKYDCDILFVGTWDEKREEVLSWLCETYHIKIYGNNRDRCRNDKVSMCVMGKAIYGKEFVKAVRVAKINLNVLRTQNMYSHNMRNMEIPGCGGVLLTERSEEIQELFASSKAAIHTWEKRNDLLSTVEKILTQGQERREQDHRFDILSVCEAVIKNKSFDE